MSSTNQVDKLCGSKKLNDEIKPLYTSIVESISVSRTVTSATCQSGNLHFVLSTHYVGDEYGIANIVITPPSKIVRGELHAPNTRGGDTLIEKCYGHHFYKNQCSFNFTSDGKFIPLSKNKVYVSIKLDFSDSPEITIDLNYDIVKINPTDEPYRYSCSVEQFTGSELTIDGLNRCRLYFHCPMVKMYAYLPSDASEVILRIEQFDPLLLKKINDHYEIDFDHEYSIGVIDMKLFIEFVSHQKDVEYNIFATGRLPVTINDQCIDSIWYG
jgi:hypothetical protein